MRKITVLCCAVLSLTTVACSSGSGGSSCTASKAESLAGSDPFEVDIHSFAYQPACFEADPNQTIKLVNGDSVPHTFTVSGTSVDLKVDAGQTLQGGTLGLAPGTYHFACTIHPQMTGTMIVQ